MPSPEMTASVQHALDGQAPCCPRKAVLASVVIPMLNEAENVDPLLTAIVERSGLRVPFEILIADGGSTDGTLQRLGEWQDKANIRVIASDAKRGLAGDVLNAAAHAQADVVVVMDADLSHPPDCIASLVAPVLDGSMDMVIGSRFVAGAATDGWPAWRLLLSRLGSWLAWPLTDVKDPMSGFFAVRRERLLAVDPEATGFKIGLEIIAQAGSSLRVCEVPITFKDRVNGNSKIGCAQLLAYVARLLVLSGGSISSSGAALFAAVGMIGVVVDLLAFSMLSWLGASFFLAHTVSFLCATVSNFFLNWHWAFAGSHSVERQKGVQLYVRYFTVCLFALSLRGGVLAASQKLGVSPPHAIILAIGTAAFVSYFGAAYYVFPPASGRLHPIVRWRVAALGVALYAIVLRFVFIGLTDLWPQEAYYWNYAQHLDIGYLDHPPLVAWLISLSTAIFGDNEFGVRFFAWFCWFLSAFFSFQLTGRLFGRSAAFISLLLVSALPVFFATGFLMTPDAPLVAAWAGALYFLERALLGGQRNAWLGAGVSIGLGMLAKYTIALLGPATLVFLLLDARARTWLMRPQPYVAALLAMVVFSPVVYWNLMNDFASFDFQSTRRLSQEFEFSLHRLIADAAILITPPGLLAAGAMLMSRRRLTAAIDAQGSTLRVATFVAVFTLVPLAVFATFSLTREVKLNWTGPLWLAAIPAVSAAAVAMIEHPRRFASAMRRTCVATLSVSLLLYGFLLNYLVQGLPGLGFTLKLPNAPVAWGELGRDAAELQFQVMQATGSEPILIGLDRYDTASQLAFYGGESGVANSVGRGVLRKGSLMYDYWHAPAQLSGRSAVIIDFQLPRISDPKLAEHFSTLGEPVARVVVKDGKSAGHFYYRIGHGFKGAMSERSTLGARRASAP